MKKRVRGCGKRYRKILDELAAAGVKTHRLTSPHRIYARLCELKGLELNHHSMRSDMLAKLLRDYLLTGNLKLPPLKPAPPRRAPLNPCSTDFLRSYEWRAVRYDALKRNDGRCELCGRGKRHGLVLHVDHIKPRKTHPKLALDIANLQVLCEECNHGKGNRDTTDWRQPSLGNHQ